MTSAKVSGSVNKGWENASMRTKLGALALPLLSGLAGCGGRVIEDRQNFPAFQSCSEVKFSTECTTEGPTSEQIYSKTCALIPGGGIALDNEVIVMGKVSRDPNTPDWAIKQEPKIGFGCENIHTTLSSNCTNASNPPLFAEASYSLVGKLPDGMDEDFGTGGSAYFSNQNRAYNFAALTLDWNNGTFRLQRVVVDCGPKGSVSCEGGGCTCL